MSELSSGAPRLVLSLRSDPEGGDLLPAVAAYEAVSPGSGPEELLLLIHGNDNSQDEALAAYSAFRQRQAGQLLPAMQSALASMLGDLLWPSDARWPGLFDLADAAHFPEAMLKARGPVAERLMHYLTQVRPGVRKLHILAHSLGCRVALELIRRIPANHPIIIGRVCLMAAAVPEAMVMPGGRLEAALRRADAVRLLVSEADQVLAWAFPVGQLLGDPAEGILPTALGRTGGAARHAQNVDIDPVSGAGHGDYWGWQGSRWDQRLTPTEEHANRLAGNSVMEFFSLHDAAGRDVAARPLPPMRGEPRSREQPERAVGGFAPA